MARGARLPGEAWTERDWALQRAADLLDSMRCSGCGQPRWLSHDKAHRGRWSVSATRCFACDAVARRSEQIAKDEIPRASAIHYGTRLQD